MAGNSIKRIRGERRIRNLLRADYEGAELERLVSDLYPLLESIGFDGLEEVVGLRNQIARYSGKTAVRVLDESSEFVARLLTYGDKDLVMAVYGLCRQVAQDTIFVAARLLEESPEIVERLLMQGDKERVMRVYGLCSEVATDSWRIGARLLSMSPDLLDNVVYEDLERISRLCSQVAQEHPAVAARLLELSPELLDRVGYEGFEEVAGLARQVAQEHRDVAVSLIEMSPELLDRVGYEYLEKIAALSSRVAAYSWKTAAQLLGTSPELIDRVGYEYLERVADFSIQVAQKDSFVAARLLELSPYLIDSVGYDCLAKIADLSSLVNEDDGFIAAKLLEESPGLITRLLRYGEDKELVTGVYDLCCQVAEDYNWRTAVRLLTESPDLFRRLHEYGDKELVKAVFGLCTPVAGYSGITAVSLLEESPTLIGRVGIDGLEKVAAEATELAALGEGRATSFVRGESSEFATFIEAHTHGLELRKVKPILAHYLNALLGYRIELAEAEEPTTDGTRIFLPARIQEFTEEARNFTLYKVMATHEEAHLEYGSFDFELMNVPDVAGRIRARYGGKRAQLDGTSELEQFYGLFPEPALAKDVVTVLEDYRINSRLHAEYPVLSEQIAAMNAHMVSKRPSLEDLDTDKQRAVELIAQQLIAGSTKEHVPEHFEATLEHALAISHTLSAPHVDVHETARMAADLYFLLDDAFQEPYQPVPPFSSPLDQSNVDQNVGNFGRTARKIREKLESYESIVGQDTNQKRPPEQSQTTTEEQHVSEDTVKKLLRTLFKEKGIKPIEVESRIEALEPSEVKDYLSALETVIRDENELQREHGTFLYHEWGSDISDYRPNWTRVRERRLEGGSNAFYQSTFGKYKGLIKSIRREFQMLRPEGLVKLREQFDGDDIDLDAAVQYFIDKRLRLSPSERNYMRTEKRSRDIAVAFLVDVSGSTGGATIACEKEALIVMSEALEELGDAFAIYGFSGYGRDNVVFYTIKDFEETYDRRVQTKISILTNEQSTRIAPAIRHTTTKLKGREENTKLIILLSDGKPLDHDYHGDYAIEDTRMALREAQRYGIKSFCITVDREAAAYLPRMYASSRWVVIDDVMKLPNKITRIYKLFTT